MFSGALILKGLLSGGRWLFTTKLGWAVLGAIAIAILLWIFAGHIEDRVRAEIEAQRIEEEQDARRRRNDLETEHRDATDDDLRDHLGIPRPGR